MTLRSDLQQIADEIAPDARVLDLGCGDGALLAHLALRGVSGYGVEIDVNNVIACVEKGVDVIQGDLEAGLAGFADLLHALVRQLVDTRGQTVGIAGWSMGAMVTLEYLRRHGAADLHSVALCSGLSKVAGVADIFHADDDASLLAEISRRSEKAGLTAADPQAVLHCWRSMQHFDCRGDLARIDVPTLVLHGTDDADCPFTDAMQVAERVPGARLRALHGAGHLVLSERSAEVALALATHARAAAAARYGTRAV